MHTNNVHSSLLNVASEFSIFQERLVFVVERCVAQLCRDVRLDYSL